LVAEANPWPVSERATPAMSDDNLLPFSFPAVQRKKVTAAFDGGRITSDWPPRSLCVQPLPRNWQGAFAAIAH
jgi:hypothetical protein